MGDIVKKNTSQQSTSQLLFDIDAPASTTVRYGDREFIATATERGPTVGSTTTTDAPAPVAATTATDAAPQPQPAIIAGLPDRKTPKRWQVHTLSNDAGQIEARLGRYANGVRAALNILADGRGHHADELYTATGGRDPGRPVREIRKLVGRTHDGHVVYAWLVCVISAETGAGVYTLDWRDRPQPRGDNGMEAAQ